MPIDSIHTEICRERIDDAVAAAAFPSDSQYHIAARAGMTPFRRSGGLATHELPLSLRYAYADHAWASPSAFRSSFSASRAHTSTGLRLPSPRMAGQYTSISSSSFEKDAVAYQSAFHKLNGPVPRRYVFANPDDMTVRGIPHVWGGGGGFRA